MMNTKSAAVLKHFCLRDYLIDTAERSRRMKELTAINAFPLQLLDPESINPSIIN
jgi:hypothetical protein